jgi:protein TonB
MRRADAASLILAAALHAALLFAAPFGSREAYPRPRPPEAIRLELTLAAPAPVEARARPPGAATPRRSREASARARTVRGTSAPPRDVVPVPAAQPPTQVAPVDAARVERELAPLEARSSAGAEGGALPEAGVEGLGPRYHAVSRPSYLERVEPAYPAQARRLRQEGVVVLRLFIGAAGELDRIEVARSSGHRLLDEAAVAAERKSRFRPATVEGRPVPCQAEVPYRFELE